jgi:heptosyltransferase-2
MTKKVFLIRFSSLGDVVLTSSLFGELYKNNYEVYLITFKPYGELFKEDYRVKVIEVDKSSLKSLKDIYNLAKELNKLNPFAVVDLHKNPKSFLIKTFLKGEIKSSYNKRSLFRRFCVFLNRFVLAKNLKKKGKNVLELYAEALKPLKVEIKNPRPKILIDENRTEEFLKKLNLQRNEYVVLGIGARYRKKEYPHFERLANLLSKDFKVVLVGDKRDYERSKDWRGVVNLSGKLSLTDSLRILKGAKLFVGNDSGATHMARAVGTKVAVFFGGTHPCLGFAPYPDEGTIISKNLPCSPCDIHGKGGCSKNYECLDISPREAERVIFKMVSR